MITTDTTAVLGSRCLEDLVPRHPVAQFNLAVEPWIPVVTDRGAESLGFVEVLTRSHEIHDLAIVDPLEKYALIRYLLAMTYLAHAYDPEGAWEAAARGEQGHWPPLPARGVESVVARMRGQWWLFHPEHPFAQTPALISLMSKQVSSKDTVETMTEGYECLIPFRPAKSNESWWYKAQGEALNECDAPLALLSRHFAAVIGNEAGVMGKSTSHCEGGVMVAGPQEVTSLVFEADRLSATLAGNLVEKISDTVTPDSVLFFEAPLDVAAHLDDALYLFTASGGAAFLVWPGPSAGVSQVLRAPLPVSETTAKQLMVDARLSDPHVLRALQRPGSPDASNPNKGIIAFSSAATQFQNVFAMYRKTTLGMEDLRDSIITPRALLFIRDSYRRLAGVTVSGGGNFTGMRIKATTAVSLNPAPLTLEGPRAQTLRFMLGHLADRSSSCLSQLSYEIEQALGGVVTPGPAKSKALRREAATILWADVDKSIDDLYHRIATVPLDQLPEDLPADLKTTWISATVRVFDTITATYTQSPRVRARVHEHRFSLGRALWNKL